MKFLLRWIRSFFVPTPPIPKSTNTRMRELLEKEK
jgi:hypothetical protein